jgi:hypothetical protein
MGDILAVRLPDGTEALVEAHVEARCLEYPGYTKDFIRTNVLKPTGPYGVLWYIDPTGERSTPYQYTLPVVSDPSYGHDFHERPLNTFRILTWDELQPLTIIPLYRDLDAARGAAYAKRTYESDQGPVVAAKIYFERLGYFIFNVRLPSADPFCSEIDRDRFQVYEPPLYQRKKVHQWSCSELMAEAQRLRAASQEGDVNGN